MSTTAHPPTAVRAVGSPPAGQPLTRLSQLVTEAATRLHVDVRAITAHATSRRFEVETVNLGDVSVLVHGLGLPALQILVEDPPDIGVVRTAFETADYHGWALSIHHGLRRPTIETKEGTPSAS